MLTEHKAEKNKTKRCPAPEVLSRLRPSNREFNRISELGVQKQVIFRKPAGKLKSRTAQAMECKPIIECWVLSIETL